VPSSTPALARSRPVAPSIDRYPRCVRTAATCVLVLLTLTACSRNDDDSTAVVSGAPVLTAEGTAPADTEADADPSTPNTDTNVASAPVTTVPPVVPVGFERVAATAVTAEGTVCELCLWLADNNDSRALGLMHATSLGDADGMLFQYGGPTSGAFWMKNTVMPLSIAFYDETGAYLDSFDMEPCTADPCPSYPTPDDFVHAIETTQGDLSEFGLTPGSLLTVTDLPCE